MDVCAPKYAVASNSMARRSWLLLFGRRPEEPCVADALGYTVDAMDAAAERIGVQSAQLLVVAPTPYALVVNEWEDPPVKFDCAMGAAVELASLSDQNVGNLAWREQRETTSEAADVGVRRCSTTKIVLGQALGGSGRSSNGEAVRPARGKGRL